MLAALLALMLLACGTHTAQERSPAPAAPPWLDASPQPVVDRFNPPAGLPAELRSEPFVQWRDPSVLREGDGYAMWAALTVRRGGRGTSIYRLGSHDGLSWQAQNDGLPVLAPGSNRRGEFDWYGVTSPAVVRSGSEYHMYYATRHEPRPREGRPTLTLGHAVSRDGVAFTKRGELHSLTSVVGHREGNPWGWRARSEPAALFHDGDFFLYFEDVRCRRKDCDGGPETIRGISLARSRDGHEFRQVGEGPVLLQSDSFRGRQGWEGYSRPCVYHDGTWFQLFVEVVRVTDHGSFAQAIAHYRSRDGVSFEEVRANVLTTRGHPWAQASLGAPSVVAGSDALRLWYAGDNLDWRVHREEDIREGRVRVGIGLALLRAGRGSAPTGQPARRSGPEPR